MAAQSLSRTKGLITMVTSEPIILLQLFPRMSWPDNDLVPYLNYKLAGLITYISDLWTFCKGFTGAHFTESFNFLDHL